MKYLLFQVRELIHIPAPLALFIWISLGGLSGWGLHAIGLWVKKQPENLNIPGFFTKKWIPVIAVVLAAGIPKFNFSYSISSICGSPAISGTDKTRSAGYQY